MNKFLNRIAEIVPPSLFLLINYPIIIGCFIDFALVDIRYLIVNLMWLMVFTIPSILLKSNIPNRIGIIFIFIIGTIESFHWLLIKSPLSVVSILTLGATNFQESMEFLSLKSSSSLLLLFPYIFLFIYSLRQKREFEHYKGKNLIISIVAVLSISFISENAIHGRLVRKGIPQFFKVCFSYSDQYSFYKETEQNTKKIKVKAYTPIDEDKTFVLIIGESLNRHHMSLYGYKRKTSPNLDKRNDIYVFNDVVSPYSNTINSVLSLMTESNLENKRKQEKSIDLFDIFSSAGFKTYWLSNQPPYGIWENRITSLAKKADKYIFVNISSNSSMEATLTESFDSKLFVPFMKTLESDVSKKLIIIHLMGSHTSYKKRYPGSFSVFRGNTKKEEIIAEYDNSVLYNDYIVDSLLNIISAYSVLNKNITSAIYLSDHGENVYDEGNQVGHTYADKLPKANVDIPFIVWLSNSFKTKYSSTTQVIGDHLEKPYVTDDLFHSILDLNSIETSYLNESKSLFNENFNDKRARILIDNKNYDD